MCVLVSCTLDFVGSEFRDYTPHTHGNLDNNTYRNVDMCGGGGGGGAHIAVKQQSADFTKCCFLFTCERPSTGILAYMFLNERTATTNATTGQRREQQMRVLCLVGWCYSIV